MKILIALLLLSVSGFAATVNLACDAADPLDQVTGYKVYEFVGSAWVEIAASTTNAFTIPNVTAGQHKYRVTAFNFGGESDPSNEVSVNTARPKKPTNLRVITVTVAP